MSRFVPSAGEDGQGAGEAVWFDVHGPASHTGDGSRHEVGKVAGADGTGA